MGIYIMKECYVLVDSLACPMISRLVSGISISAATKHNNGKSVLFR